MSSMHKINENLNEYLNFKETEDSLCCPTHCGVHVAPSKSMSNVTSAAKRIRVASRYLTSHKIYWNPDESHLILVVSKYSSGEMNASNPIQSELFLLCDYLFSLKGNHRIYLNDEFNCEFIEKSWHFFNRLQWWNATDLRFFDFESLLFPSLVISLGGDGTVLQSARMFKAVCPPILPLYFGSLGFLTVVDKSCIRDVFEQLIIDKNNKEKDQNASQIGLSLSLRSRLRITIFRYRNSQSSSDIMSCKSCEANLVCTKFIDLNKTDDVKLCSNASSTNTEYYEESPEVFNVLNEVVVDRGPSPFMSIIEVYGDDKHITTVQADGLAVATPTGSTAYSLAAGGSLTHPSVPTTLLTPICPHTLSFRPMLLPETMNLKIVVPCSARGPVWASFDGRSRRELKRGDCLLIQSSDYPVPLVCRKSLTEDWFASLGRCLSWNDRKRQHA